MDANAVRHGVGWGWRALAAVFAVLMIGAGVASGPSTGAWVAIGRTSLLPLHLRAENKGPAYVFVWLAAGLLTIAGVGLLLARYEVALLLALSCALSALWARSLWARRFAETTIDEGGISFLEGVRRRHVPHGVAIALVANDQRQHVLHVWDAQDRVVASFGPSQGLARIAAHLLAARAYVLPVERSGAGSEQEGRDVDRR